MTSGTDLGHETEHPHHAIQLYGQDDRLLAGNVARYLAEGYRREQPLLVLATAEHREALTRALKREGIDAIEAVQLGRLVFRDARVILDQILVNGKPDWERFEAVVGNVVREIRARSEHGEVRAFGELVGLLWKQGDYEAAIEIEGYWNRLLEANRCSLFCAYPIDVFGREFQESKMDALLRAHSHVIPVSPDLEPAVDRAITEVLGSRAEAVQPLVEGSHRGGWAILPRAEATVLWLKRNLHDCAEDILSRTRRYYRAARLRPHRSKPGLLKTGDAARLLGTTTRTLLFYEEEGLVRPRRTHGGSRMYSPTDLNRIETAIRLSRLGFPLKVVKQLASVQQTAASRSEAAQRLTELFDDLRRDIKTRLASMQALSDDLEQADALVRECGACSNARDRQGCAECPADPSDTGSALLRLALDSNR